jgi:hypothetical protein
MNLNFLKKSTDSENRLLYSSNSTHYIIDFKLAEGKITGYSPNDIQNGNAIGLIDSTDVQGIDMYAKAKMWIAFK